MIRVRRPFLLAAPIPISKSWLNRALILKSLHPDLRIFEWEPSELDGEDVTNLRAALQGLAEGASEFQIGESGTGFRFLMARLSLEVGHFRISGSAKLLTRPHDELFRNLELLGTTVTRANTTSIEIQSRGWPDRSVELSIDASESSQFASALRLAASRWPHELKLNFRGPIVSRGYFDMTLAMLESMGGSRKILVAESDASSVATLACVAVAASEFNRKKAIRRLESQTWDMHETALANTLSDLREKVEKTAQPDRAIFDFLKMMRQGDETTHFGAGLRAIEVDIGGSPDLFPVLAALSAFASGESRFGGAPHLRLKESDRISGIARLFRAVGIDFREHDDGMTVHGLSEEKKIEFAKRTRQGLAFQFDPESDHRLAFAAAVLGAGGVPIEVSQRGVVTKSLPLFWTMIEGDAPRVVLVGQRGAGKTEAVKRWGRQLGVRATIIDLDREVERLAGRSIDEVFKTAGEAEFRRLERKAWREVDAETRKSFGAVLVSTGAGFDPDVIDDSWTRVWLRRATDAAGRIFTDRPRLDIKLDPLTESIERSRFRRPRFHGAHDRQFIIGEGTSDPAESVWGDDLLGTDERDSISGLGGTVTLLSHHNVTESCERWRRWGVARIEIRDDFWPSSKESPAWDYFVKQPQELFIVSFRSTSDAVETRLTFERISTWLEQAPGLGCLVVDWPMDAAPLPTELANWVLENRVELIGSVHGIASGSASGTESLVASKTFAMLDAVEEKLARFPRAVFKVAIQVADFKTLIALHTWAQAKPQGRVFLPMSGASPRWAWYRLWCGSAAAFGLSFWREDDGSSLDQPTFSQWWRRRRFQDAKHFAAVLGSPVEHSRTPLEHDGYFKIRGWPVFAIEIARDEMPLALLFLQELGLKAAAVTAPLKQTIQPGRSINTLALKDYEIKTTNTDGIGFEKLWQSTRDLRSNLGDELARGVAVWGGGGVLSSIESTIAGAVYYSASTGRPRSATALGNPAIVIWAAADHRGAWPIAWRPRLVIDLSYTENSIGRAIALEVGARYVSGLLMFETQAEAQREFWTKEL